MQARFSPFFSGAEAAAAGMAGRELHRTSVAFGSPPKTRARALCTLTYVRFEGAEEEKEESVPEWRNKNKPKVIWNKLRACRM